ncbi:hypothetical protein E2C01_021836 [Portunus trituberculatus]|uniref:Uncharacterized protein n=1 Tax=Portunus trituberculatus TaxID=210409 RepID=A0A5B7E4H0_PORTR|nr:hypothetical protein [Portunus trituberculatus]
MESRNYNASDRYLSRLAPLLLSSHVNANRLMQGRGRASLGTRRVVTPVSSATTSKPSPRVPLKLPLPSRHPTPRDNALDSFPIPAPNKVGRPGYIVSRGSLLDGPSV